MMERVGVDEICVYMEIRSLAASRGRVVGVFMVDGGGEVGVKIGVDMGDLGDVAVKLLDERDVLGHVVGHPGLVVLVHLLNQQPVPVQNRLHLPEAVVECGPHLWVPLSPLLHLILGLPRRGAHRGRRRRCHRRVLVVVLLVVAPLGVGVFHLIDELKIARESDKYMYVYDYVQLYCLVWFGLV